MAQVLIITTASVQACELPQAAFLRKYHDGYGYADCYVTEVAGAHSQAEFVEAFYTTRLFKIERSLLGWFAARASTDADARQLAQGTASSFAAWSVEGRSADQMLLADFTGRTKSWLMAEPVRGAAPPRTRLYFGSAVVPRVRAATGERSLGFPFRAMLGFHRLYSRLLLGAARSRIGRPIARPPA